MIHFLQGLIAAVVWLIANVVYVDMKRKGLRGFTRFAAFWAGTPTTWITLFAVSEGTHPTFEPSAGDDDAELLLEVRRDRARRLSDGTSEEAEGSPEARGSSDPGADPETGEHPASETL
jgi:hypothetical protein